MANQVFHYSNTGVSSGQRFYLKDEVSGLYLNRLNLFSDSNIEANNLVYNTGNQNISGIKIFGTNNFISSSAFSHILGGSGNQINNSNYTVIAGGRQNTANGQYSNVAGGIGNTANGDYSNVAGGLSNSGFGNYSNIAGGHKNTAVSSYSNIAGGHENTAVFSYSNIAGGHKNTAVGSYSNIAGGYANSTNGQYSNVAGGWENTANGQYSNVAGGLSNSGLGNYSNVAGGHENTASGVYSSIAGGRRAKIASNHFGAAVWADGQDRDHESKGQNSCSLDFASGVYLRLPSFEGSSLQAGNLGELKISGQFLYIATGVNSWGRTAISTFT